LFENKPSVNPALHTHRIRVARFFLGQHTNTGKITMKYAKWPQNIPNGHKIYQMATTYTKWPQNIPNGHKIPIPNGHKIHLHLPLQDPLKFTQIGIFSLKTNHLATLHLHTDITDGFFNFY
jgi:hypothetical protein